MIALMGWIQSCTTKHDWKLNRHWTVCVFAILAVACGVAAGVRL